MGKKYLVVSDNHGNMRHLKGAIKHFRNEIDGIIHCGDVEYSLDRIEDLAGCPVYAARGNCDFVFDRDYESLFELDSHHVALVTHGDRYGVAYGFEMILDRAAELGADVIFYGHTHRPAWLEYEDEDGIYTIMNPGSIELPRQFEPSGPTFATLEITDSGMLIPQYYCVDRLMARKFYTFDIMDYSRY